MGHTALREILALDPLDETTLASLPAVFRAESKNLERRDAAAVIGEWSDTRDTLLFTHFKINAELVALQSLGEDFARYFGDLQIASPQMPRLYYYPREFARMVFFDAAACFEQGTDSKARRAGVQRLAELAEKLTEVNEEAKKSSARFAAPEQSARFAALLGELGRIAEGVVAKDGRRIPSLVCINRLSDSIAEVEEDYGLFKLPAPFSGPNLFERGEVEQFSGVDTMARRVAPEPQE